MKISIIIFIIIFIIIIILNKNNKIEGYDSIKTQNTLVSCANICKTTNNCFGFGYNKPDGTCYLSQKPLFDLSNLDSKYVDEYNKSHIICNKIDPVMDYMNDITKAKLINNAAYNCHNTTTKDMGFPDDQRNEKKNNPATLYLSKDDRFKKIKDLDYLYRYELPEVYKVRDYDWDKEKYLDDMFINKQNLLHDMLSTDPGHVFQIKSNILNRPEDYTKILDEIPEEYMEYAEFNIGDYVKPYHCINDINLKRCMLKCNEDDKCIGFEHNPELTRFNNSTGENETSTNLCCMKKNIGPFVNRSGEYNQYKDGRFYLKSKYYPLPKDGKNQDPSEAGDHDESSNNNIEYEEEYDAEYEEEYDAEYEE